MLPCQSLHSPSHACVVSMIQCYNPEEKKKSVLYPNFFCCWYSCYNSHYFRHPLNAALESLSSVCTAVASNFVIARGLLEVEFLGGSRGKHTYCSTEKGKKIPYIPLYGAFSSLHNAFDLSLLSFLATDVHHELLYFSSHASREQRGQVWKCSGGF